MILPAEILTSIRGGAAFAKGDELLDCPFTAGHPPARRAWITGYAAACVSGFWEQSAKNPLFDVKRCTRRDGARWQPMEVRFLELVRGERLPYRAAGAVLGRGPGACRLAWHRFSGGRLGEAA